MSLEEADIEDNSTSLSVESSLDDDFDRMHIESDSSDEVTDGEVDLHVCIAIASESNTEFLKNHALIEEVIYVSERNAIDHID